MPTPRAPAPFRGGLAHRRFLSFSLSPSLSQPCGALSTSVADFFNESVHELRRLPLRRGPISFFFDFLLNEKNLLIPAAAGSSPSMQPLVLWLRADAFGAGAILELGAQLVWCQLYDMKD